MTPTEFIALCRQASPLLPAADILEQVNFVHNGKEDWGESDDINSEFRESIADALFEDYSTNDYAIITYLLKAEITYCQEETTMGEALRQLTFMLYSLGKVEDIPLLFEAKMDTSFDAGCGLDIELIFGIDRELTKDYYTKNPNEDYDIVAVIEEYEQYEYRSPEVFMSDMKNYYGK